MYTHILHATDLSENHHHMCRKAVEIAKRFDAELSILHVLDAPASLQIAQGLGFTAIDIPNTLIADARTVLSVLGEEFAIPPERQTIKIGSVYEQIHRTLEESRSGLLIIGRHYRQRAFPHRNPEEGLLNCDVFIVT